jgi:hypothetical protein
MKRFVCFHCHAALKPSDERCPACGAFESKAVYESVTFGDDVYRAVVNKKLQKPEFNSSGAALAFGHLVAKGVRKAEDVL